MNNGPKVKVGWQSWFKVKPNDLIVCSNPSSSLDFFLILVDPGGIAWEITATAVLVGTGVMRSYEEGWAG